MICQNPLAVSENNTILTKSFEDPTTDCSAYLEDYIYLNDIKRDRLFSHLIWNATSGTGAPFLARWRTRIFSVFTVPFYFLSIFHAVFLSIWLKIVIGGIGIYLLALTYNLLPSTSLLVATIFQTLGIFTFVPLHPITDTVAIAPYYLVILNLMSKGNTKLWLLLTLPIALMLLGGRLQSIIVTLIFSFLYLLLNDIFAKKKSRQIIREIMLLSSAWLLGFGVILFQILPYIEWARLKADAGFDYIPHFSFADIFSLIIPVASKEVNEKLILQKIINSPSLFLILLIPLYISGRKLIKNKMKRNIEFFWISATIPFIVVLLLSLDAGKYLASIELLKNLELIDTSWIFILATALLIGLAIESWNLFNPDECRNCTKKLIVYAPLFWGIIFISLLAGRFSLDIGSNTFWYHYILGLALLSVICLYFVITLFSPSPRNGVYAMIIIFLAFSQYIYGVYKPHLSYTSLLKSQEAFVNLEPFGKRISTFSDKPIIPSFSNKVTILPPPKEKRTSRLDIFFQQALNDPNLWTRVGSNVFLLPSETDYLNNISKLRDKLRLLSQDKSGISIFKYDGDTSRAYVIYNWKNIPDIKQITLSSNFPHIVESTGNDVSGSSEVLNVNINDVSSTKAIINVPKTKPGILVISDTYYPGWEATIDGKPTEIVAVNGAFRGIELSEGEHIIEISYTCTPFYVGGAFSFLFLLTWFTLAKFTLKFTYSNR
ncbi:MAG: YfhO family protein [Candidatus Hydrogenedentes bacterium]|nr:YfhO family protein [Candidatus Hydrogenedentota bacterium]